MARKIYYKVLDDGKNLITDLEWEDIARLQHWYNSEFIWTAGKLGFRMFAVFPNAGRYLSDYDELRSTIRRRKEELKKKGLSENEIIHLLAEDGLIIVQKGGYFDNCIASGFTRVGGNEHNAYLVLEFLLKVSLVAKGAVISVYDEGQFVKSKGAELHAGAVILRADKKHKINKFKEMVLNRHVFSIVDPAKYDNYPALNNNVSDFNELEYDERMTIIRDWNWLGFGNNYDRDGNDITGLDLNKKVSEFRIEDKHN